MNEYLKNIVDFFICLGAGLGHCFSHVPWGLIAGFLATILSVIRILIEYPKLKEVLRKRKAIKMYNKLRVEKELKKEYESKKIS